MQPTHRGTFSCVITHDQRPLARLYFFLNGAGRAGPRGGSLVISARSATSSVHAQSRDLDLISHVISACRVT